MSNSDQGVLQRVGEWYRRHFTFDESNGRDADAEEDDSADDREIMWRSVGLMLCEDGSTYVVQQMVAVSDTVEMPYDSHRTIHIDAARNPADFNPEDIPDEWQEAQQRRK